MKSPIKHVFFALLAALFLAAAASAQMGDAVPAANDVVAKMMASDVQRKSESAGYVTNRRYVAANGNHRAEMVVRVTVASDASEDFNILSENGSGWIRHHIFRKLLKEEAEASRRGNRDSTRITPANYQFQMIGRETLDTGPAYVFAVVPRTANKYLIDGKIWVDAKDFSIVRIEGRPARNPSFWIRSVNIVRTYEKVGPFWLASSTRTTSHIRILGLADLTIENFDYTLGVSKDGAVEASETIR